MCGMGLIADGKGSMIGGVKEHLCIGIATLRDVVVSKMNINASLVKVIL